MAASREKEKKGKRGNAILAAQKASSGKRQGCKPVLSGGPAGFLDGPRPKNEQSSSRLPCEFLKQLA